MKRDPHIKKEGETSRGLKRKSPEPEAAPTQPESPRSKYVGSKYVGVYNQGGTTWRAQHSNRYLGMFQTELEAAEAYAKAAGLREPLIKRNGLSGLALLHDTRARERVAAPPERDASNERVAPTESATGGDDSADQKACLRGTRNAPKRTRTSSAAAATTRAMPREGKMPIATGSSCRSALQR